MKRILILSYGVLAYLLFHAAFLYLVGFVVGVGVPRSVDAGGPAADTGEALLVNALLLALFGVQHAVMARPGFKRRLTRIVPAAVERSTFMIATCVVLAVIFWQWRPMAGVIWDVSGSPWAIAIWGLCAAGWSVALVSTFLIDHFELFGLRQVIAGYRGVPFVRPAFTTRGFYGFVRHPLMLGFLVAFWATPTMGLGHFVFAMGMTAYILVGVSLEEKDLLDAHPRDYARYRAQTGMILPAIGRRRSARAG